MKTTMNDILEKFKALEVTMQQFITDNEEELKKDARKLVQSEFLIVRVDKLGSTIDSDNDLVGMDALTVRSMMSPKGYARAFNQLAQREPVIKNIFKDILDGTLNNEVKKVETIVDKTRDFIKKKYNPREEGMLDNIAKSLDVDKEELRKMLDSTVESIAKNMVDRSKKRQVGASDPIKKGGDDGESD